jgi:MarR family transcriptional regulator, lower aerobic nicotinate degradation pathway regulator
MDDQSDHRHQRMIAMPGHLLRRCHQIAVALFLDECAPLDLTPLQYSVLIALAEHGPCDQASLGGLTAIDRTTAQVVCGNLSKLGLVTRTRSRVDKRAKIIAITPAGRELLRAAVPLVERTQQRIVAPLTPRERERLTRLLGKIADKNNAESRAPYKPRLARARRSRTERAGESRPARSLAAGVYRSQRPAKPARDFQ